MTAIVNTTAADEAAGRPAVTVLGLGQMGAAIAGALLAAGHPVTVWNRTAEKAAPLVEKGAVLAGSVAEAVAASPLVLAVVLDYPALYGILDPASAELKGKALVNLVSGSPEQADEAVEWAARHGLNYLDGAIMTTPPGVGTREVMFLYSGDQAVFDAHHTALDVLGEPLYLGAEPGLAALYDVNLLGLMWATMSGWLHGTAVATAEGTRAVDFTEVAIRWLGTVGNFIRRYAAQVDEGAYPGDDATVDVQIATIEHQLHAARARGVDNRLPELLKTLMVEANAKGHGQDSFGSVIEVLRQGAR
ncbi:NAD(P)-dependent oxidoreductase [Streptomyces qinzhouensis]|uniref:NAD(P)-dependent oxidoreductase n=1 Tax=Streptomyces qinzhouensis TaxID=2599401 RepID=A0A5B8JAJ0_9ACTN|nr:NAD(P)-binding domain-containing protein [Streptomyces qinzhouensis]QDY78397.1 NAD(P)-dependent oxidoreductase [Streptomyces qinzhouensis]